METITNTAFHNAQYKELPRDIAERRRTADVLRNSAYKHTEQALRDSEERYRHLVENIREAIYALALDGTLTYISPAIQTIMGIPPEGIVGRHFSEFVVPEDVPLVANTFQARLAGERGYIEWRMGHANGEIRWVQTSSTIVMNDGEPSGFQGVLVDITERKQVEVALRNSEMRLKIALDTMRAGVWEHDLTTGRAIWDDRTYRLFGLTPDSRQLTIEQVCGFIVPEDFAAKYPGYQQALAAEDTWEEEYRIAWPDGSIHWIAASAFIFRDAGGNAARMVGLNFDSTPRKQMEAELLAAKERALEAQRAAEDANRAKSVFLANMNHELRTPLNGILGYAQILNRDPALDPNHRQAVEIIERSGHALLTLINDILNLAKVEAGKVELAPEDFAFLTLIRDVMALLRVHAERKGLALCLEAPPDLPQSVHGDPHRLRQILINLLGNAVKFTEHGSVTLRIGDVGGEIGDVADPRTDHSPQQSKISNLKFEIIDSGIGIAPDDLERIFEPFQQAGAQRHQRQGTGLGLTITRRLIQLMGGELHVSSVVGQGSVFEFCLSLPVVQNADHTPSAQQRVIVSVKGSSPIILVVDDHADNCSLLRDLLTPLGFTIYVAHTGAEGLRLTRRFHPDAVMTDIRLPDMDGLALIRQFRKIPELANLVVMASSASVYRDDQQHSCEAGSDAFLPKPIEAGQLFDQLQRLLHLDWTYADERPPLESNHLVSPPREDLNMLSDLAGKGDIRAIRDRLDMIERQNSAFGPFANRVRGIVSTFQMDELRAVLQACQTQAEQPSSNPVSLNVAPSGESLPVATLLVALPSETLDALESAAILGDVETINQCIAALRPEYSNAAQSLAELAAEFDYGHIVASIRNVKSERT